MNAEDRINALIACAGSPVMIVKNNKQYSASARMAKIDKQARMMAHQLNSKKYECTISIMGDEIIAQDAKIRDMANTINRLEAALSNVINEREQLMKDLKNAICENGECWYCVHYDKKVKEEPCNACYYDRFKSDFVWRGVPDLEE